MGTHSVAPSYATAVAVPRMPLDLSPRLGLGALPRMARSAVTETASAAVTLLGEGMVKIGLPGQPWGPPPEWSPSKISAVGIAYGHRQGKRVAGAIRSVVDDVQEFRRIRRQLIEQMESLP